MSRLSVSGWLFLGFALFMCSVFFWIGHRDANATQNPYRFARSHRGDGFKKGWSIEKINRSGRIWRAGSVIVFILMALVSFGVFELEGIDPIF